MTFGLLFVPRPDTWGQNPAAKQLWRNRRTEQIILVDHGKGRLSSLINSAALFLSFVRDSLEAIITACLLLILPMQLIFQILNQKTKYLFIDSSLYGRINNNFPRHCKESLQFGAYVCVRYYTTYRRLILEYCKHVLQFWWIWSAYKHIKRCNIRRLSVWHLLCPGVSWQWWDLEVR